LCYDDGLFCYLLQDDNHPFEEKYPPETWVERFDPETNMLLAGTVMDIPFLLDPSGDASIPNYTLLFNNGSSASIPLEQMASLIPPPPITLDDSETRRFSLASFSQVKLQNYL
jgi:hypothetical protein